MDGFSRPAWLALAGLALVGCSSSPDLSPPFISFRQPAQAVQFPISLPHPSDAPDAPHAPAADPRPPFSRLAPTALGPDSSFLPLLPPAVPLAIRSPYLSTWLAHDEDQSGAQHGLYLARQWPRFWPVQFPAGNPSRYQLAWSGLIRIDGKTYRFMGQPEPEGGGRDPAVIFEATQLSLSFTSTQTIFEFQAGPIKFKATFLSPFGPPGDLLRQSLPFSYLAIEVTEPSFEAVKSSSPSENQLQIEVYTDLQTDWASGDHQVNATWSLVEENDILSYQVERQQPLVFSEEWEYAEWGQAIYATSRVRGLTTASGPAAAVRSQFARDGTLGQHHDRQFRKISDRTPSLAYSAPLNIYGNTTREARRMVFTIGHVRDPYVSYIKPGYFFPSSSSSSSGGASFQNRYGYWRSHFNRTIDAIKFFLKDFDQSMTESNRIDQMIDDDARKMGGENYVPIVRLSARQAMSNFEITVGKNVHQNDQQGKLQNAGFENGFNQSDVLVFSKEISSNGDMSTVDVIFPQFPILAYLDPNLLKLSLDPLFEYSESGMYPHKWTVHDLGRYPNATGHNDGNDEWMPVEEAGNMLIMSLAYYQLTNDTTWLSSHYDILSQWTSFLIKDGLIPANQLSTDDFAGPLANQTNLALKAIVGIGCMSEISKAVHSFSPTHSRGGPDSNEWKRMRKLAQKYVRAWIKLSLNDAKTHTKLAYQAEHSWGTIYNLFPDRLLNLRLIPSFIYELQTIFYPTVANDYGVPLDSRHKWAKTDWQMFAVGAVTTIQTRDLMIEKLIRYLKAGRVNAGFPDLYETETGAYPGRSNASTWRIEFINRPVVGAHFSLLALDKFNQIHGIDEFPFRSGPIRGTGNSQFQTTYRGMVPLQLILMLAWFWSFG